MSYTNADLLPKREGNTDIVEDLLKDIRKRIFMLNKPISGHGGHSGGKNNYT